MNYSILKDLPFKERISILSTASSRVNALLILFIAYCFYVFIVSRNVEDLDLFITGSTVQVPIINYNLDTWTFYLIAPMGLILLQNSLFLSLKQYLSSVNTFKVSKNQLYNFVIPFLFNRFDLLSIFLKIFLLIILPTIVYLSVFISFLPYHSILLSIYHCIIIGTNFILCIYFFKIFNVFSYKKVFSIFFSIISGLMIILILSLANLEKTFELLKFKESNKRYIELVKSHYLKMFSINLSHLTITISEIRKHYNRTSISMDFKSRDLRYLTLYNTTLSNANFSLGNISNSNFNKSNINNVNFKYSIMENSSFDDATLNNCEFGDTKLKSSTFIGTKISNSNFISVHNFIGLDVSKFYFKAIKNNLKDVIFAGTDFNNVLLGSKEEVFKVRNFRDSTFQNTRYIEGTRELQISHVKGNQIFIKDNKIE